MGYATCYKGKEAWSSSFELLGSPHGIQGCFPKPASTTEAFPCEESQNQTHHMYPSMLKSCRAWAFHESLELPVPPPLFYTNPLPKSAGGNSTGALGETTMEQGETKPFCLKTNTEQLSSEHERSQAPLSAWLV